MTPLTTLDVAAPDSTPRVLDFDLPPQLEASEPPEARGGRRDDVRMLVSIGAHPPMNATFRDLPWVLAAGDLLVVNTSATIPAAFDAHRDDGTRVVIHVSTALPADLWVVEVRRPVSDRPGALSLPFAPVGPGDVLTPDAGTGAVRLLAPFPGSHRLWTASVDLAPSVRCWLETHGRPIRYGYVPEAWPIEAYQTVFGTEPGSAEMPSASRPFTAELVTSLAVRGIGISPVVLHTGVSSLEAHEPPYPEQFEVPRSTADRVNDTHRHGGRVIAIGTTAVRALESAADVTGTVHPADGWADVIVTPERGVHAVDGLLTGWHEPQASHLQMLEAIAGRPALELAYREALAQRYRWHEFGDVHLILRPGRGR